VGFEEFCGIFFACFDFRSLPAINPYNRQFGYLTAASKSINI
jgi:hypothetical protein